MQPAPFPPFPSHLALTVPREPVSAQTSPRGLSETLLGPEREWATEVLPAAPNTTEWRPALSWAAGAIGCGLCQAAVAVAARPDAGIAQLSSAGTAMAAGTWLYLQGVKSVFAEEAPWAKAALAGGSWVGAIAGVGLATVPVGPVRMAGIGLDVLATQGFHAALTDAFIRGEQAHGRHETLRQHGSLALTKSSLAVLTLAVLSGAGLAAALSGTSRLGSIEAAGVALFCHALIGSSVSAYLGLRAWQKQQEAQSPRRGWQSS